MLKLIKDGWNIAWRQPFAVLTLFIYNLLWGLALFKMVYSIIVPLLHRYPSASLGREATQLFWIESQFRLTKTDMLHSYLWLGFGLLAARMLLTPLINAGLYYSLHHTLLNSGYRFVRGIRQLFFPYLGLYALQIALSLAPLYWLAPEAAHILSTHYTYESIVQSLLPIISVYLLYGYLLRLVCMYVQFALADGSSAWSGMFTMLRGLLPAVSVSVIMLLIGAVLTVTVLSVSLIWAGFFALILYQLYRLANVFCRVWSIASQYRIWLAKTDTM